MTRRKPLRAASADVHEQACRKLQSLLQQNPVGGLRFRPHQRIGPYMADFHCPAARLVLLLFDGGHPADDAAWWLRANGYRVLEFPGREVLNNPQCVLDAIAQSVELRVVSRRN